MDLFEASPHFASAVDAFDDAIESQSKGAWLDFAKRLADVFVVSWCEGASTTLRAAGMGLPLPKRPTVADCKRVVEMSEEEWGKLTSSALEAAVEVAAYEAGSTADISEAMAAARKIVVVRTNASRSFHQGQQTAGLIQAVMDRVPLYKYTAKMDSRTRPTHRQMNGYFASPVDIEQHSLSTPCGFNCRCKWKPVTMAEARRLGLVSARGAVSKSAVNRRNGAREALLRSRLFPDPGFGTA